MHEFSVSVVIPLYNKASFVCDAVDSALQQIPAPLEVIVVDDGSTDGGAERVKQLNDVRIRIVQQKNAGVSAARNVGISLAKGSHVAFLDADDLYRQGHFANLAALAGKCPNALMLCTGYIKIDNNGNELSLPSTVPLVDEIGCVVDFYRSWCRGAFTFTSAIAVRRDILERMWPVFPVGEKMGEDQDLWFRLAEAGAIAYSENRYVEYRINVAGSATQTYGVDEILPAYQRLYIRTLSADFPPGLRNGARKLFASHLINLARSRQQCSDFRGAARFLFDRRSLANSTYWLRAVAGLFLVFSGG
jgi:glycosyltransferase involved in cell wall biosynthesis